MEMLAAGEDHGFSYEAISVAAGMRARTVYRHFPDRMSLLQATNQHFDILDVEIEWLVKLEATGGSHCMLAPHVPPDVGVPPHQHPDQEAFFVLDGQAEFAVTTDE